MQVLEGSVIYRLLKKLYWCYELSGTKRIFATLKMSCQNSFIARCFHAVAGFKIFSQNSLVLQLVGRIFKKIYRWIDRFVIRLSDLLQKWSEKSLLCSVSRFIARASEERIFVLAAPVFGIGYFIGRVIIKRLMIRDILFLSLTFLTSAVLLIDRKKLNTYFRNSLVYKLYLLVLG